VSPSVLGISVMSREFMIDVLGTVKMVITVSSVVPSSPRNLVQRENSSLGSTSVATVYFLFRT
jgi:hypothetical protein